MEIRTIGQQYTVLVDGRMINQFDNSIPKIASRNGDPATVARQFARGYLGLQTHGGNDRISYREIQVKEFAPADIPVNTVAPTVTGTGFVGAEPHLQHRHLDRRPRASRTPRKWYRSNKIAPTQPALPRPEPDRPRQLHHAGRPDGLYGNQDLTWLDSLAGRRGRQQHLHADRRGRRQGHPLRAGRRQRRRHGVEDRDGPGDPGGRDDARSAAPCRPTLSLTLGAPASFGDFLPGVARDYDASTTATVVSSAGDATLSVSDRGTTAVGHWSTARPP